MIKSFKHKGLKLFFETGTTKGIRADQAKKIRIILAMINVASTTEELAIYYQFHELKGDRKGIYSMTVSGNWRITFEFVQGNAYILNYEDYH